MLRLEAQSVSIRPATRRRIRTLLLLLMAALAPGLGGCLAVRHGLPALTHPAQQELLFELEPVDLPASGSHEEARQPQPLRAVIPVDCWMHGFTVEVVDARGDTVPGAVLHHVKLMVPEKRELFMPIMLRLVGAGAETRAAHLPPTLGVRLSKGDSVLVTAMLHNPTPVEFSGVRVRLQLRYTPANGSAQPTEAYPFFLHVTPPDQHSGFDLPPGRSERSWEARPAVAGRIFGLGGHLHRFAAELRFEDLTARRVLWSTHPRTDSLGNIIEVPRKIFWSGMRLRPDHLYRVTVVYDNPTGTTIRDGGMGTLGGVFLPEQPWPAVDREDPVYRADLAREMDGAAGHHSHGDHHHH